MTTVLIIDDMADMRLIMKRMLQGDGYDVVEAENGIEGLRLLESRRVDLVITDVFMPEADGIEFLRAAARIAPETPAIAVSGGHRIMPTDVALTLTRTFGAASTLYKPFRKEELMRCVRDALVAAPVEGPALHA